MTATPGSTHQTTTLRAHPRTTAALGGITTRFRPTSRERPSRLEQQAGCVPRTAPFNCRAGSTFLECAGLGKRALCLALRDQVLNLIDRTVDLVVDEHATHVDRRR